MSKETVAAQTISGMIKELPDLEISFTGENNILLVHENLHVDCNAKTLRKTFAALKLLVQAAIYTC